MTSGGVVGALDRFREGVGSPIFVVGCGRSGTHWLGEVLDAHPDLRTLVEAPQIFPLATSIAIDPSRGRRRLPVLLRRYRREMRRCAPRRLVDKSHPNLWLVEELLTAFPLARFVAIRRDPFATVHSMLGHLGVRRWCDTWRSYPVPNRFLGITTASCRAYSEASLTERLCLRWRAHADRIDALAESHPETVLRIDYEALHIDPGPTLRGLEKFLGLRSPLPPVRARAASLDHWRQGLSEQQRLVIERVSGVALEAASA